ncbi:hypothetical protein BpHYR1_004333 [Brachionus plicatilis]|uniref:Uncharacterized protein n=1 Tax=Brachionus plicatilis TaxID=10195 RepID=A0A3M7SE56_BRAPC|nr:hypothetical protein BpHYR1_004333 [Brachionus plicatilis]
MGLLQNVTSLTTNSMIKQPLEKIENTYKAFTSTPLRPNFDNPEIFFYTFNNGSESLIMVPFSNLHQNGASAIINKIFLIRARFSILYPSLWADIQGSSEKHKPSFQSLVSNLIGIK